MSRHLEELATPRISELGGGAFSAGGSQIGGGSKSRWPAMLVGGGGHAADW